MKRSIPTTTLGDRFAAALVSLVFSVPLCGLYWLVVNYQLAGIADTVVPLRVFAWLVVVMGVIGFVFPTSSATLLGWLCDLVFAAGRWG